VQLGAGGDVRSLQGEFRGAAGELEGDPGDSGGECCACEPGMGSSALAQGPAQVQRKGMARVSAAIPATARGAGEGLVAVAVRGEQDEREDGAAGGSEPG
jgi:hypothetical protein